MPKRNAITISCKSSWRGQSPRAFKQPGGYRAFDFRRHIQRRTCAEVSSVDKGFQFLGSEATYQDMADSSIGFYTLYGGIFGFHDIYNSTDFSRTGTTTCLLFVKTFPKEHMKRQHNVGLICLQLQYERPSNMKVAWLIPPSHISTTSPGHPGLTSIVRGKIF